MRDRDAIDDWFTCYFALQRSLRYLVERLKNLERYRQKSDSQDLADAWKATVKELEDTLELLEYMRHTSRCIIE